MGENNIVFMDSYGREIESFCLLRETSNNFVCIKDEAGEYKVGFYDMRIYNLHFVEANICRGVRIKTSVRGRVSSPKSMPVVLFGDLISGFRSAGNKEETFLEKKY